MADDEAARRSVSERSRAAGRIMAADIIRLSGDYPRYDTEVLTGLFETLLRASGRVPTYEEARDYLERYTTTMTSEDLRDVFVTTDETASTPRPSASVGLEPVAPSSGPRARRGRPPGRTTTIPDDEEYRRRWGVYLRHCGTDGMTPTLTGFATWTGVDVDSGAEWPLSTIKDYRRKAKKRGIELPPTG
jgi:hypothetical protein